MRYWFLALIFLLSACSDAKERPSAAATTASREVRAADTLHVSLDPGSGRLATWATFRPDADSDSSLQPPEVSGAYVFAWGNDSIVVQSNGSGLRLRDDTDFSIAVREGSGIVRLAWARAGSDLLVWFEENDMVRGTSFVARIDSSTLRTVWLDSLVGFNLGTPVLDSASFYTVNIAQLARIDLVTGSFLWRVDDLYAKSGCDAYDHPALVADTLVLHCSGTRPDRFHRQSGRLLRRGP